VFDVAGGVDGGQGEAGMEDGEAGCGVELLVGVEQGGEVVGGQLVGVAAA
jgi:hypothetical protein